MAEKHIEFFLMCLAFFLFPTARIMKLETFGNLTTRLLPVRRRGLTETSAKEDANSFLMIRGAGPAQNGSLPMVDKRIEFLMCS